MDFLRQAVADYGYLAIFIGTFLEGETILVLGGIAAQQGLLDLQGVMLTACVGSLAGDQTAFLIGRRWGRKVLARFPSWQKNMARIEEKAARYLDLWMLTFRFFYGLRNPTPFVLAMGKVSMARFALFNAMGAAIWAVAGAAGGYVFGYALERFLGQAHAWILAALAGVALLGGLFFLARSLLGRAGRGEREKK
ncbi:MAG: DedA family protein [Desulfovibrio sp.]|nr:DedA family protein [Desulfovibrio sp.]